LVCVYIPPNSHINVYSKLCESIENIVLSYSSLKILIIGDFNLASCSWLKNTSILNAIYEFLKNSFINLLDLTQLNDIVNSRHDILDFSLIA